MPKLANGIAVIFDPTGQVNVMAPFSAAVPHTMLESFGSSSIQLVMAATATASTSLVASGGICALTPRELMACTMALSAGSSPAMR